MDGAGLSVLQCDGVSRRSLLHRSEAERREVGTTVTIILCALLPSTDSVVVPEVSSVGPRDRVYETADTAASFKSEVQKHFGFTVSGNEKR